MADVVLDSSFNWTGIQTGMEEMRAFANKTTAAIGRDIQGMFAGTIAVGAIVGGLHSIVEEAHQIHLASEKFRIDAEQLQSIGAAAKDMGIPLESVARAMNLLELNSYKAAQGTKAQAEALEGLGINAKEFYALRADEKILALADAYEKANDKAAAYAQIATLVGRRNTDIIALIQEGRKAIEERGAAESQYTDQQIAELDAARAAWVRLGSALKVIGAEFTINVVTPILNGIAGINKALADMWAGAQQIFKGNIVAGLQQFITGQTPIAPQTIQPVALPPGALPPAGAYTGPGGAGTAQQLVDQTNAGLAASQAARAGGGVFGGPNAAAAQKDADDQIAAAQKLAQIQRDAAFARLSAGGQLAALQRELAALQAKELTQDAGTTDQMETQVAIAQKQGDIEKLSTQMSQDQVSYDEQQAKLREKMAEQANQELADSQEQTTELNLQAIGRKDLADRARIEYDYNSKIHDAQNAITAAEAQGFTEVANTNRALVTQLSLEKQTALAAHDKATAEEMAAKAAQEKVNVERETNTLAQMKEENALLDLRAQGREFEAEQLKTEFDFNVKINEQLGQANDLWAQMVKAYAEGNTLLGDQLAKHAQLKQAEADELAIEKQKTQEMQLQNQNVKLAASLGISPSRYADLPAGAALQRSGTGLSYTNAAGNRVDLAAAATVDTSVISYLASGNLRLGATSDVYAAALAYSQGLKPGTAAYNRLLQQITAEDQLKSLQGNVVGDPYRDKLVQWYAGIQQQQASAAGATLLQQQIDYWSAIAAGRMPLGTNPYLATFGVPNLATGTFAPATADNAQMLIIAELQSIFGLSQSQIVTLLQQIAANTKLVTV